MSNLKIPSDHQCRERHKMSITVRTSHQRLKPQELVVTKSIFTDLKYIILARASSNSSCQIVSSEQSLYWLSSERFEVQELSHSAQKSGLSHCSEYHFNSVSYQIVIPTCTFPCFAHFRFKRTVPVFECLNSSTLFGSFRCFCFIESLGFFRRGPVLRVRHQLVQLISFFIEAQDLIHEPWLSSQLVTLDFARRSFTFSAMPVRSS